MDNKILDWSKLKEVADDKFIEAQTLKLVFRRVENIVGKGENAGYQHFLLFPQYFQKSLSYHTMTHFDTLKIHCCGKHCEKRKNCL